MQIVIVGNGAVGLMTARAILAKIPEATVRIVGPAANPGSASLAAAAMFNSFAEVDTGTFRSGFEKRKWLFNRLAAPLWKDLLVDLEGESQVPIARGFGTYVINNHVSDILEDHNFDAVVNALKEFHEPHELVPPSDIPCYKPASPSRAGRAVLIPNEGWVNPVHLLNALREGLRRTGRAHFIDGVCEAVGMGAAGRVSGVRVADRGDVSGDFVVLSPGANFSRIISASSLGLTFPRVFYGIGCTVVLRTGDATLSNCVRTPNRGLACGVYSAPRDKTHTVVGASNLISPVPVDNPATGSVYTLLKAAMEQINSDYYRAELETVNLGWRPTSEDTLPMIGRTDIDNLLVATATKRDGLHCSPVIAQSLAELIATGKSSHDIDLFKPDRKPVRTLTRAEAVEDFVRHSMNANFQHDFVPAKNRMIEQLERMYRDDIEKLHDQVGAKEWGIPPEMISMYRYNHVTARE